MKKITKNVLKNGRQTFFVAVVLLSTSLANNVSASDEDPTGVKSSSMVTRTTTWEEKMFVSGNICEVTTYKATETICSGQGTIDCSPGVSSFEEIGTELRNC